MHSLASVLPLLVFKFGRKIEIQLWRAYELLQIKRFNKIRSSNSSKTKPKLIKT